MNNPTEVLRDEHRILLRAVRLARQIQQVSEDQAYYVLVHDMILFLRNFTEIYHHPKEENIFYPALQVHMDRMGADFIHEVCDTHQEFKSLMAEIENHYVMYDYRLLRKAIQNYLDALVKHIASENQVILSVADDLLSQEQRDSICREFDKLDRREGDKEQLKKLLTKLGLRMAVKSN